MSLIRGSVSGTAFGFYLKLGAGALVTCAAAWTLECRVHMFLLHSQRLLCTISITFYPSNATTSNFIQLMDFEFLSLWHF